MSIVLGVAFAPLLLVAAASVFACSPSGGIEITPAGELFNTVTGGESTGVNSEAGSGFDPTLPGGTEDGESGEITESGEGGEDSGGEGTDLFVGAGSLWRYTVDPPGDGWTTLDYDDSGWLEGQAPLGGGAAPDLKTLVEGGGSPVAVRLRRRFEAAGEPLGGLLLQVRRADAASVYVNGEPVLATNLGTSSDAAETSAAGNEGRRYLRFAVSSEAIQAGGNVLAVELYRRTSSADFAFDMQLEPLADASEVYVQLRTRGYDGEYGDRNVGAIWVETEGGAFVRTLALWADVRRQHLVRWRMSSGEDDTDAITAATRKRHATTALSWDRKSAAGALVAPGSYVLRAEFTEDDSNKGAPLGPTLELPFVLGSGVGESVSAISSYRDITVIGP